MRYYHYGREETQKEIEAEEKKLSTATGRFGELIIDEDTVYEIDEECLRCKKEKNPRL